MGLPTPWRNRPKENVDCGNIGYVDNQWQHWQSLRKCSIFLVSYSYKFCMIVFNWFIDKTYPKPIGMHVATLSLSIPNGAYWFVCTDGNAWKLLLHILTKSMLTRMVFFIMIVPLQRSWLWAKSDTGTWSSF
jgi:hypothetical protein